jgi:hypothetical protein
MQSGVEGGVKDCVLGGVAGNGQQRIVRHLATLDNVDPVCHAASDGGSVRFGRGDS